MTRILDFIFAFIGILILSPLIVFLLILGYFDTGSPLFFQERLGKGQKRFQLVKFRSMDPKTKSVATHLANPDAITPLGSFLRKFKLDELPQLWNVLVGDMSLVGPRPNLPNQTELIGERSKKGVYAVRPGITGLAQVRKIDMSTPALLAETDAQMIAQFNFMAYFKFILMTLGGKGGGDRVKGKDEG